MRSLHGQNSLVPGTKVLAWRDFRTNTRSADNRPSTDEGVGPGRRRHRRSRRRRGRVRNFWRQVIAEPGPSWPKLPKKQNGRSCQPPIRHFRSPITGFIVCCARAASGHEVAAPAITLMKSRRRTAFSRTPTALLITAGIYDRRNGVLACSAQQQSEAGNVRFGSKADIGGHPINVRFTPKSGHWNSLSECPLCAKSRH
jgi:hypothetical protein